MLRLARAPSEVVVPVLPGHRALRLWLVNAGEAPVVLERRAVRLLDGHGTDLRAACTPSRAVLRPGEIGRLDLVYRVREGGGPPARLEHADGAVELGAIGRATSS